ncbi:CoA-binding protein [Nakamurella sp. GG22]
MTSAATTFDAQQTSRHHPLVAMFEPRSVAIIGASDRSTWSTYIHAALRSMDYPGQAYFVNPRGGTAHGERLYPDLASLPETPDQVFVIIPAAAVIATVAEAAARGVRAAVVLTSGFAEIGADGKAAQDALHDIAKKTGIRILGPNNLGFAHLHARIGLTPPQAGAALSRPDRRGLAERKLGRADPDNGARIRRRPVADLQYRQRGRRHRR